MHPMAATYIDDRNYDKTVDFFESSLEDHKNNDDLRKHVEEYFIVESNGSLSLDDVSPTLLRGFNDVINEHDKLKNKYDDRELVDKKLSQYFNEKKDQGSFHASDREQLLFAEGKALNYEDVNPDYNFESPSISTKDMNEFNEKITDTYKQQIEANKRLDNMNEKELETLEREDDVLIAAQETAQQNRYEENIQNVGTQAFEDNGIADSDKSLVLDSVKKKLIEKGYSGDELSEKYDSVKLNLSENDLDMTTERNQDQDQEFER